MKPISILFFALFALMARAQYPADESLQAKGGWHPFETDPLVRQEKPNEWTTVHLTYSGVFVEVIKMKNPLELINPAAPPEYGWAENNVLRDPFDGHVSGLKIFSIEF